MIVSDSIIYPIDLIVYHPILKDWLTFNGVGAVPLHTAKTGISIAIHGNTPLARAFAVQNAAKSIGRLFGSSLNNEEDEMMDVYSDDFKVLKKSVNKGNIGSLLLEG